MMYQPIKTNENNHASARCQPNTISLFLPNDIESPIDTTPPPPLVADPAAQGN